MDRDYIDKHLLIDRYLQGDLADDDVAAFEERLAWDQELIDELDLAEKLREGLRAAVADDQYVAASGSAGIVRRLTGFLSVPQYAAAASFVLAVTLTAGVLMSPLVPIGDSPPDGATPTDIVPLLTFRSGDVQTIVVNENAWTVLLVDAPPSFAAYRVSLRRDVPGAAPFWLQEGLLPTYPDALAVGMPGKALPTGAYVLSLDGRRDTGTDSYEHIQNLHFQAVAAE